MASAAGTDTLEKQAKTKSGGAMCANFFARLLFFMFSIFN